MLFQIGRYFLLMYRVFQRPDKGVMFRKQLLHEINTLGIQSLGIIIIISLFMGAVVAIQTVYNIESPFIPIRTVGFTVRETMILEFSPTMMSLILAGKVGSQIASEIGTMRITEQIDALDIMGINSANHLIFPKVVAAMLFNPFIVILSMGFGILGGHIVSLTTNLLTPYDSIEGFRLDFDTFSITFALIKTVVFAYILTSVAGYMGYYVKGGALDVGKASTRAVVWSSFIIILFNLILTQIFLS